MNIEFICLDRKSDIERKLAELLAESIIERFRKAKNSNKMA